MLRFHTTAQRELDAQDLAEWRKNEQLFAMEPVRITALADMADAIDRFENGKLSPTELINKLSRLQGDNVDREARMAFVQGVRQTLKEELDRRSQELGGSITWATANETTRREIARAIIGNPESQAFLLGLQTAQKGWEDAMQQTKIPDAIKELAMVGGGAVFTPAGPALTLTGVVGKINTLLEDNLGMQIVTLGNVFDAASDFWEATKSAIAKGGNLRKARAARAFGTVAKMLPWVGIDIDESLNYKLQSAEAEGEKEAFEFLDRAKASYERVQIFMQSNTDNYIRLRGTLKYAATRGWLYEFLRGGKPTAFFGVSVARITAGMSKEDAANYISDMQSQNKSGADKEVEGTASRERLNNSLDLFEKSLNAELDDLNLNGAVGVMKAAVGRGRVGHTGPALVTIFLSRMRTDPKLRSLVSPEMLDNMFGWALSEVPFTLANIQVQRGGIATWITAYGADDEAMAGAGSLVSVIGAIERRLRVVSPGADRKEINGLVGKILAGHTIDGSSGYVSIFDDIPEFNEYRKQMSQNKYSIPDIKGADDYIAPTNGRSEMVIAPTTWISSIIRIESSGNLAYEAKTENLIIQFCDVHDELKSAGMHRALDNFKREVGDKVCRGLLGQRPELLTALRTKYINTKKGTESIAVALGRRGLLSQETQDFIDGKKSDEKPKKA